LQKIKTALAVMASLRGAKIDAQTLSLYGSRLGTEILDDVIAAIEKIAEKKREEGELAFPEIGAILSLIPTMAAARHTRDAMAKDSYRVVWRCPECRIFQTGWIGRADQQPRICQGAARAGSGKCGAIMQIFEDERPKGAMA
jgi:hypothetical protein